MDIGAHEFIFQLPFSVKQEPLSRSPSLSSISGEEDPDYCPSPKSTMGRVNGVKRARKGDDEGKEKKRDIALPPPPMRTRRIIQMDPSPPSITSLEPATSTTKSSSDSNRKSTTDPNPPTQKKKVSRKTAHSVIERRRRGKMNDEFEALKCIIPACKTTACSGTGNGEGKERNGGNGGNGRDMHKLEILRASVQYIRHLERCVDLLKTQSSSDRSGERGKGEEEEEQGEQRTKRRKSIGVVKQVEDLDGDIEMLPPPSHPVPIPISTLPTSRSSTTFTMPLSINEHTPHPPPTPRISPAILPQPDNSLRLSKERQFSYSSAMSTPPFGPVSYQSGRMEGGGWRYASSAASSVLCSPALGPLDGRGMDGHGGMNGDMEREVKDVGAALLMLGQGQGKEKGYGSGCVEERKEFGVGCERREWGRCRGLSVRDLLIE